jgi:hypothetical protein
MHGLGCDALADPNEFPDVTGASAWEKRVL